MTKPITKKRLLRHALFWVFFFAFIFLGLYSYMRQYRPVEWVQLIYYVVASVASFYAIGYFTNRYLDRFYTELIHEPRFFRKAVLLVKWQTLMVLLIFGTNLFIALWLGNDFCQYIVERVPNGSIMEMPYQRASSIAFFGVFYAYIRWNSKRLRTRLEELKNGGSLSDGYGIRGWGLGKDKTKN